MPSPSLPPLTSFRVTARETIPGDTKHDIANHTTKNLNVYPTPTSQKLTFSLTNPRTPPGEDTTPATEFTLDTTTLSDALAQLMQSEVTTLDATTSHAYFPDCEQYAIETESTAITMERITTEFPGLKIGVGELTAPHGSEIILSPPKYREFNEFIRAHTPTPIRSKTPQEGD